MIYSLTHHQSVSTHMKEITLKTMHRWYLCSTQLTFTDSLVVIVLGGMQEEEYICLYVLRIPKAACQKLINFLKHMKGQYLDSGEEWILLILQYFAYKEKHLYQELISVIESSNFIYDFKYIKV